MKRIVFCFDGTWNKIDGDYPTNVARIAQSVSRFDKDGVPQIIHYDEGVGTTRTERFTGGMFGKGVIENIVEAYHFLVLNYEPGDKLYVFGFSRGAFSARSFVGLIRNCAIISRRSLNHIRAAVDLYMSRDIDASPNSERARQFRFEHAPMICLRGDLDWRRKAHPKAVTETLTNLEIEYLGVWDTVGALGIPKRIRLLAPIINRKYAFHDTTLSSFVKRARHALAADERRRTFEPSLWTNLDDLNAAAPHLGLYEQQIFPGVHSAVGGGGPVLGLSDAALEWIFKGARTQGLAFDTDAQSPVHRINPDHRAQIFNATGKTGWTFKDRLTGFGLADRSFDNLDQRSLHPTLVRRFAEKAEDLPEKALYQPASLEPFWPALERMAEQERETLAAKRIELKSMGDERALRVPDSVRNYIVRPGDRLETIAAEQMGSKEDTAILLLHNRNVGLIFEDSALYAGSRIEIPVYAAAPAADPSAKAAPKDATDDHTPA